MKHSLKSARVRAKLSVKQVAEALGIYEDTLYKYEKYITFPRIDTAYKMAALYGCSIDDIDFIGDAS